jgi:iron complex outermembrane receptor protein
VPFAAAQANVLFEPEQITTYEVGFKSEFMDRRVRFNLAAFHYDYTDLQVSRIVDLGGGAAASLIDNAATSKVNGIDAELVLRPSDNFDFSVAYGFLDAKYDTYTTNAPGTTPTPAQIYSGTRLVRAPKHTLNVGAEWRLPLGADSQLMLRADYAMLSDFFHEPGEANPIYGGASSLAGEDGYGLLDLRASVDFGAFKVTGFVTNVLNTDYRRTVFALGSTASDYPGQPRIFGAKVGYSF